MSLYGRMLELARLEYRADRDANAAVKLIRKFFGYLSVDLGAVQRWFTQFEDEKVKKFNSIAEYGSELAEHFSNGEDQYLHGMLSQVSIERARYRLSTFGGRIAYGIMENEFVVIDIFHGKFTSLSFLHSMDSWDPIEFIDDARFLVFDWGMVMLHLYKFDFDAVSLKKLDSVRVDDCFHLGTLTLDQSDPTKFIVGRLNADVFCTGKAVEDKIVVDKVKHLGVNISWPCLNESKLQFICTTNSSSCKLYELDLQSQKLTSMDTETKFSNGETFDLPGFGTSHGAFGCFAWSDRHFYINHASETGHNKIAALDTNSGEWVDTGIKFCGNVHRFYIDQGNFLTAITYDTLSNASFYRFALKKPDSLVNLAWFAYTRTFKTTGERGKLFENLPYTCDLRLNLPGINQESDGEAKSDQEGGAEDEQL